MTSLMKLYKLDQNNIKDTSTEDLAKLYYIASDNKKDSASHAASAKKMNISDWKVENTQRTLNRSKDLLNLVLDELGNRGVKSVARNGEFVLKT